MPHTEPTRPSKAGEPERHAKPLGTFGEKSGKPLIKTRASERSFRQRILRRHFAGALRDARNRKKAGSGERGRSFGDGWEETIAGVDCYVYPLFGVELEGQSKSAPLADAICIVMILDPDLGKFFQYGRGVSRVNWWRSEARWLDPLALFEAAYADAVRAAYEFGEFSWRRDARAISVEVGRVTKKNRRAL